MELKFKQDVFTHSPVYRKTLRTKRDQNAKTVVGIHDSFDLNDIADQMLIPSEITIGEDDNGDDGRSEISLFIKNNMWKEKGENGYNSPSVHMFIPIEQVRHIHAYLGVFLSNIDNTK